MRALERCLLAVVVAVIGWMVLSFVGGAVRAAERPNVLFIAVDDLRPELNCYGRSHIHSPNIDRLARTGVLFERAYCMVPTCGASRASLMTGVRPARNRFTSYLTRADQDAPQAVTMNTHFRRNGYTTMSIGKVFHHTADSADGWSEPAWRPRKSIAYHKPENIELHRRRGKEGRRKRGPAYESADAEESEYADGAIAAEAVRRLSSLADRDEPFFLAVGFLKPHLPFVAPKKYWNLYDPADIRLPKNYHPPKNAPKQSIHNSGELRAYAGIPARGPVSDDTARKLIHGYYACVSFTDAQIGKLLDAVDQLGLADNTIVVLWGDHGWNLGEHTLWCKHSCYETSMQIPLIVRAPGVAGQQRRSGLIETIDLYPTLCELSGLQPPSEQLQGDSFATLLRNADADWKDAAIGRFGDGDTIRTDDQRYSEYTTRAGKVTARMLYDHTIDPRENVNIAPASHADVERLSRRLRSP